MKRDRRPADLEMRRIRVSGFSGLLRSVDLELDERTVLVGRNGAGKSAIMAAAVTASRSILTSAVPHFDPFGSKTATFECELGTRAHRMLTYRCEIGNPYLAAEPKAKGKKAKNHWWTEECTDSEGATIWQCASGRLLFGSSVVHVPDGVSFLALPPEAIPSETIPSAVESLKRHLAFDLVPAGVARTGNSSRDFLVISGIREDSGVRVQYPRGNRLMQLAGRIAELESTQKEQFEELGAVLTRMGLGSLNVNWTSIDTKTTFALVDLAGVNIGLLSDGTLRVCEILVALLPSKEGILWIEEPETGIHPGLLERLLAEINSYGRGRQVVISTHSPYVVGWCEPAGLRLVERTAQSSVIRRFSPSEIEQIEAYLREEGSLGEYVLESEDIP